MKLFSAVGKLWAISRRVMLCSSHFKIIQESFERFMTFSSRTNTGAFFQVNDKSLPRIITSMITLAFRTVDIG